MWWSIVVQMRGQSMQEATAHVDQMICAYDGDLYGDREAKKMARKVGREYISLGGPGQPRLVKTPLEPRGEAELAEVEAALEKGLVPPGMTLEATALLRETMNDDDGDGGFQHALAAAERYGIDFGQAATSLEAELSSLAAETPASQDVLLPNELAWRTCRLEILLTAETPDDDILRLIVQAAEIPGSDEQFDLELERLSESHGLEPLVAALHDRFFTTDVDEAGTTE